MRRRLVVGFAVLTALMLSVLIVPLGVIFARQQTDRVTLAVTNDAWVMATAIEETLEGDATVDLARWRRLHGTHRRACRDRGGRRHRARRLATAGRARRRP